MTLILCLTGSIGMGKSTTAAIFKELGIPVWDADSTVHALYEPGGAAVEPITGLCPAASTDRGIDRAVLRDWLADEPERFRQLEAIVHPLVALDRAEFVEKHKRVGSRLVVLDIPLLFESGGQGLCDAILVVTASPQEQRARVMKRPGMTALQFERLLAKQMPDREKRSRADYVIETRSLSQTRAEVKELVSKLTESRE